MKETSGFDPIVSAGIPSIPGRHEEQICLIAVLEQFRRVVMTISQHETDEGIHARKVHRLSVVQLIQLI